MCVGELKSSSLLFQSILNMFTKVLTERTKVRYYDIPDVQCTSKCRYLYLVVD